MTEEQSALLEKARASIAGAQVLMQTKLYGFAASRAYYAMFYAARVLLLGEGVMLHKHSAVIAAFGLHFAKTGRAPVEYHRYLIQAQDDRIVGDYESHVQVSEEEASVHIVHAQQFLDWAEKTLKKK